MLITKTAPVGIDVSLQKLQAIIHDQLVDEFGTEGTWDAYKAFGRCYRNRTSNGYVAEYYEGNNEYKDVYWDDSLSMITFFGVAPRVNSILMHMQDVHLIVFANLSLLYPAVTHRADEELHKYFLNIIGTGWHGITYTGYETGLENVLREYPGTRTSERLKYVDMHPVHAFRINFSTSYSINQC
jgi:hypothetical protein